MESEIVRNRGGVFFLKGSCIYCIKEMIGKIHQKLWDTIMTSIFIFMIAVPFQNILNHMCNVVEKHEY